MFDRVPASGERLLNAPARRQATIILGDNNHLSYKYNSSLSESAQSEVIIDRRQKKDIQTDGLAKTIPVLSFFFSKSAESLD